VSDLFISKITPTDIIEKPSLWFIFCRQQLLIHQNSTTKPIPEFQEPSFFEDQKIKIISQHYLGIWQNQHCYCAELENIPTSLQHEYALKPLREAALNILAPDLFHIAGKALQIINWDKNNQFCSRCGKNLTVSSTERAKNCEDCQLHFYPRLSPCIIVLIKRGKEILLARSPHFTQNMYGLLAGFIEPGESVEHAVEREVMEEVGIKIKNIRYHFSQPWPFPDSLMLGFTADHAAGEITIDGVEIEDAGWFTADNLPAIPASISIARKLIDSFIHHSKGV
jgi:NAD+ diphosphatase